MRVNSREERRKHGITCHTSSPLEKGRAEGAGWMCLEEALFYAETSMATVQSAAPYRQRKRSRRIFAALVCDVTSRVRNESTILHMIRVAPWRRGAPKAQDRCASKRHPSTQRSVWQLCKAPLRIVISSEARNLCHSRSHGQWLEIPNGKPAIHLPSGIAPYILQRSCHHNPEP